MDLFKKNSFILFLLVIVLSCTSDTKDEENINGVISPLAKEVASETLRSWQSYKKYAWGHDVLMPLSKSHRDWYAKSLYISPIDAYSTLKLMGFEDEATEIESYVTDSLDFDVDVDAVTSATITSAVIFQTLSQGREIYRFVIK